MGVPPDVPECLRWRTRLWRYRLAIVSGSPNVVRRRRKSLAFVDRAGKMPPAETGGGEDDGPNSSSYATRSRSQRCRGGALPQLRPQRHYLPGVARRPRRAEARSTSHPLCDVPEPPPDGGG